MVNDAAFGFVLFILMGSVYAATRYRTVARHKKLLEKINAKLEVDLADRRLIEHELAHMASFADMAPHPIVELNADGSVGYINPAAEQEFPMLVDQGKTHPLFEGLKPAVDLLAQENKTGVNRPIKVANRTYDQRISLLNGGPRIRLYMSDITELKVLDQLKTDFVNMVSHELRAPLTTIAASIKMVTGGVMGAITAEQSEALTLADVNIDRLARMINDLLDVSKIEAGKLEIHRARVDVSALVKEVCRSFEPLAQQRGLEIRTRLPSETIETLVDRDKILQVFTNLMNNALKFTEKGYVEVSASMTGQDVQCRVSDTGPGIPPALLPKVFGKFQQLGASAQGREKGTGLGLSLCKGFIELHGGRIWVESRPQEGTQFIFVLPQLGAETLYKEKVRTALTEAVATEKPLSLLCIHLKNWMDYRQTLSHEEGIHAANQLQELVESIIRSDSDPVLQNEGTIQLILPAASRSTALKIAERFQNTWRTSPLVLSAGLSPEVEIQVAGYPEDGSTAEQLISSLTH